MKQQETLINVLPNNNIHVYTDQGEKEVEGIGNLPGVRRSFIVSDALPIFVDVDPRFNQDKVSAEIRAFLTSEVPDVFQEE